MAEQTFGFSEPLAIILGRQAKASGVSMAGSPNIPDQGPFVAIGQAATSISARSGTTVGSGTVTVKILDEDNILVNLEPSVSFEVKNLSPCPIDSGQYVHITKERFSGFWIVSLPFETYVTDVFIEDNAFKKKRGCSSPTTVFNIGSSCP